MAKDNNSMETMIRTKQENEEINKINNIHKGSEDNFSNNKKRLDKVFL